MAQVKLGGYPAKQCARRTHNQFAPGTPEPVPVSPDVLALVRPGRGVHRNLLRHRRQAP